MSTKYDDNGDPIPAPPPAAPIYEGHAEKLTYGWWERKRGHVMLPATIGDKRNYVLSLDALREYEKIIAEEKELLTRRASEVRCTIRALETGKSPKWEQRDPVCFTLAHAMRWLCDSAKFKLATMQWMIAHAKARRDTLVPGTKTTEGEDQ